MKKLNFGQKIFSVTNNGYDKVICILGFYIKYDMSFLFKFINNFLPVDRNKIVFSNFTGNSYGCNPKYIAEEIIKRKLPFKLIWLVKNPRKEKQRKIFPAKIKLVKFSSIFAMIELATAGFWIDNQRKVYHIRRGLTKKAGQCYIQTWHGSLGIKKIGLEANMITQSDSWVPIGIADAEMIDYLISNSKFESEIYKKNFWNNGKILECGHPRNDIFFKNKDKIKSKILSNYNLNNNVNICLYVPSYRDDNTTKCYDLDYEKLKYALAKKFGGNWKIFVRMHPALAKLSSKIVLQNNFIIDVSDYPDVQELLAVSDIAISDYSSCIFDFVLTRKPAFIYATDIQKYNNERGLYYPLSSTPFSIAENNEQLEQNILNFDNGNYQKRAKDFLWEKGCIETGTASSQVVDLIEEIM